MIDVSFDFRSDTPGYPKRDPDALSPTLRRYHKHLWSKELPCGVVFTLTEEKGHYLRHRSALGKFSLASDTVIPTFARRTRLATIIERISPEEREVFHRIGYTIGGMMVFPAERILGKMTINGARGFHPRINDRFDLTVECIRRHYCGKPSPLSDVLARYATFFALFEDFRGFVEFFLLQDIVNATCSAVEMFTPFHDFASSPLPDDLVAYLLYREHAVRFIEARNRRIEATLGA